MKYTIGLTILLFFLVSLQLRSLFNSGFFPMHDDTQVARVVVMGNALINGQFPVRWVSDLGYGYGYPLFNFYGPLPYYFGGLFYAVGFSGLNATKIMIGLGVIFAAWTAYIFGSRLTGKLGGFLLALSYSYMPYHATQIYVRGAIGEYWATIFYPLVLLGIWLLYKRRGGLLWLACGISGVMLSHTLSGFFLGLAVSIFLVISFLFVLSKRLGKHQYVRMVYSCLLGFGLSAFFWIPSIAEMNYTNVSGQVSETASVFDHFVCVSQLWYSSWGFGGSVSGCQDGMSFALGRVFILLALSGSVISLLLFKRIYQRSIFLVGFLIVIVSLFLMNSLSSFIWQSIPGLVYLQYPWRLLSWTMLGMSLLIGLNVYVCKEKILRLLVVTVVAIFIVLQGLERFQPQYSYQKNASDFESREELRFRASKISDEYLPKGFVTPKTSEDIVRDTMPLSSIYTIRPKIERETYKKYEIESKQQSSIVVQQMHFPGWLYLVNGKEHEVILKDMLPVLTIPQGFSTVELLFKDTAVRRISNLISLIIVVVLVYTYGKKTFR